MALKSSTWPQNAQDKKKKKLNDLTTWKNASYVSRIISTMTNHSGLLILLNPHEATHSSNLAPKMEWLIFTKKAIYAGLKERSDVLQYLIMTNNRQDSRNLWIHFIYKIKTALRQLANVNMWPAKACIHYSAVRTMLLRLTDRYWHLSHVTPNSNVFVFEAGLAHSMKTSPQVYR